MKVLLTGGSGDLGSILVPALAVRGDEPINLDICQPKETLGQFVKGSILDRSLLESVLPGVDDVARSVLKAVDTVGSAASLEYSACMIDGLCEFSTQQLEQWDWQGEGMTFKQMFGEEAYQLALRCGLDPASKPKILGSSDAERIIGYRSTYGFAQMLKDLADAQTKAPR